MPCCQDPEFCQDSICVPCPKCGCDNTLRLREPNAENLSEFQCTECLNIFEAKEPSRE